MHSYTRYLDWARHDRCPSLEWSAYALGFADCFYGRGIDPQLPPALADSYRKGWKIALSVMPKPERLTLAFSS